MQLKVQATLDAIDCNGRTADAVREVARVLKANGFFVCVSCRDPEERLPQLDSYFDLKVCSGVTFVWIKSIQLPLANGMTGEDCVGIFVRYISLPHPLGHEQCRSVSIVRIADAFCH